MKSYLKFLSRNKLYTFINVLGLSISLMFVILIANYVVRNLTIDNNVEKKERIYILGNEDYMATGYWNGQRLKARYPEVEQACGVAGGESSSVFISDKEYGAKVLYVDTTFFEMFSIKVLEGDAQTALISKGNVVISKSFANKVFGTANPIGQTVKFTEGKEENRLKTVVGIIPDIENSIFPEADIITNFLNIGNSSITSESMNNAGATGIFLLEKEGANLPSKTDDILAFFKTYFWPYVGGSSKEVLLVPFKGIYFADYDRPSFLSKGDKSFVAILISVGFLILLFSIVNYINLTVAQTGFRAKEMATRRLLGSSRGVLFGKLISESLVMCLAAFIIGFILAITFQPFANDLLQSKIDILKDFSGMYLASYICLIIFVSVLSGVIPASIISNFQPIEVVRGTFRRKTSMVYGKILIAFQNIITVTLIAGSITMLWQINHLINAPMGYNYKNVIDISVWSGFKNMEQVPTTVNALKALPFVELIGQGQGTPLSGGNNNTIAFGKERMISFQILIGDKPYYQILDMEIKRDNKLSSGTGWYFNEYAFKELGVSEDVPAVKMGA
ncbi:MAG: ABC transporter permease [Bacteroidales bacterium]